MPIANGAKVRQIMPAPLEGVVIERRLNDSESQIEYHVESRDADGDGLPDRHWFLESQLVVVPESKDEADATTGEGA